MIWPMAAGGTPELHDVSEIRDWLIETTNDPELLEMIMGIDSILSAPSMTDKRIAIDDGIDDVYETLLNKHLINPRIGNVSACGRLLVPCNGFNMKIVAKSDSVSAESYTFEIIEDGVDTPFSIDVAGVAYTINLATNCDGNAVTTAGELKAALEAIDAFNLMFRVQHIDDLYLDNVVEAMAESIPEIDASPAAMLVSNATEIDDAVSKSPLYVERFAIAADKATGSYGVGSSSLSLEAKTAGTAGNLLIINIVNPGVETASTTAVVNGNEVDVTIAVNSSLAITATVADVRTAINAATGIGTLLETVTMSGDGSETAIEDLIKLSGGKDATAAPAGAIRFDDTKLYIALAECTASDGSGWKEIAFVSE